MIDIVYNNKTKTLEVHNQLSLFLRDVYRVAYDNSFLKVINSSLVPPVGVNMFMIFGVPYMLSTVYSNLWKMLCCVIGNLLLTIIVICVSYSLVTPRHVTHSVATW